MQQKNHKNTPKRTKRGAESYDDDDEYIEDDDYLYDDDDEDGAAEYFLDEDDENEILLMLSQQDYMEEKEGGGGSGGRRYHEHAAPTASASNFSIRSTGEQTMDGTLQSVPSFSVVARAEVYQQALRSALPRYLPNGSAKANVEVRDQLQAVLHTLQRLHGSARHQMRHLNQQIDEACKALRYLKADIADCESEEETQRRMRWELHVEQHRRQRLMQILYNSKKSFERYTASRAVHLEKEVEFCASHTQPCIFSNKIEASFAGGRLSAHRRLTASLHAMHKKADQLAKDITRTKMERRLVMSSAAYQQGPGPHHRRVLFSSSVGSPNGSVTVGSPGKDGAQSLTALLGATTTLSTSPPSPMKTVAGGAGVELNTFAGFQLVRNAKENAPNAEEAWYMEDEIRRNEVQERDLYQAVVLIQKRIKRKTEELAELEDRKARANRFDESREAHRVERQLFRSESAAELIALKRRQSAGLIGESRRNTLLQMTPQRIERGRGVHRDSDGMLSIHSLGEDVQRQHQRRSPHRHHGGGGPDDSPANERTLSPWNAPPKEKGPYTFLTEIL